MEDLMMHRRHHNAKKTLSQQLEKLERINDAEERAVGAEITRIKRRHVAKFGRPKPMTNMPLRGIASETDDHSV
jgi:hypothetical protein